MNNLFLESQPTVDLKSANSQPEVTLLQSTMFLVSVILSYRLQLVSRRDVTLPRQKPHRQREPKPPITPMILTVLLTFWASPYIRSYWSRGTSLNSVAPPITQNSAKPLPVQTTTVGKNESHKIWRSYTGTLVARRQSSLSLERAGKITQVLVNEGDRVTAGMPIAYLDTQKLIAKQQELLARRTQLTAQLQELKTGSRQETIEVARLELLDWHHRLKLSRLKQQRRQQLYREGAISLELFDEATTEVKSHQARYQQAQNKLQELRSGARSESIAAQQAAVSEIDAVLASLGLDLEKSILKAPFSGTIAKRLVDEGTVVAEGQAIVDLVEQQALEARIGVPVAIANRLVRGNEERLQIDNQNYRAKVLSILPQLDPTSRTATVVFKLEDSARSTLRVGQVAQLKLATTITDSGYWLPTTALTKGVNGLWTCYVLGTTTENDRTAFEIERRHLETIYTDGDRVLVRGTLQAGERAIVSGTHRLVPNMLVQPVAN